MTIATRYTHAIRKMESRIQEMIPDGLGMLGDDCGTTVAAVRKHFQGFILDAEKHFQSLTADIAEWRESIQRGDTDFSQADEDEFKDVMAALIAAADLLAERADVYHDQGFMLHRPPVIGVLNSRRREARKILEVWQSPEWEVVGRPTVQWNKEQTRHLRERLASRK